MRSTTSFTTAEGIAKPRLSAPAHAAGVDADDAAADVDERPAGVAGVDRGVGLDPEVVGRQVEVALDRGDDAAGDRALEAVRAPPWP
jgi:hypothetical protein